MSAKNKDDDPVTFKVFNAFQKEIFERFDVIQKQLDGEKEAREEERKAREEEKKAREEERKAREEERKAQAEERKAQEKERRAREEERQAREEEKKRREEAHEEIWKELGEYNLLGAVKKTILLHYGMFIVLIVRIVYFCSVCILILVVHTHSSECGCYAPCKD